MTDGLERSQDELETACPDHGGTYYLSRSLPLTHSLPLTALISPRLTLLAGEWLFQAFRGREYSPVKDSGPVKIITVESVRV